MTDVYNLSKVTELMERVVELHGEETTYESQWGKVFNPDNFDLYDTCANFLVNHKGERVPACVVGVGLNEIVPVESWTLDLINSGVSIVTGYFASTFDIRFTDAARHFLAIMQSAQDEGDTWGTALGNAKARIKECGRFSDL